MTSLNNDRVTVEPDDGYGEVHPQLMQTVPREAFQGVDKIEVGMTFEAQGEKGEMQKIIVKDVDEKEVVVDANHPLAGVTLNFDVSIVSVREASEEELEHGHAH